MKKITELFKDSSFVQKMEGLNTIEEVQAAFQAHGVDVTLEELKAFRASVLNAPDEALSAENMDYVLGGGGPGSGQGGPIAGGPPLAGSRIPDIIKIIDAIW
jgi:hypothetical protein